MTRLKFLSVALIAAATLATPAMARESHVALRHHTKATITPDANYDASYNAGRVCYPAPAVGAFATQPWDNGPPCEPTPGY
jgi:hypothetical protein